MLVCMGVSAKCRVVYAYLPMRENSPKHLASEHLLRCPSYGVSQDSGDDFSVAL